MATRDDRSPSRLPRANAPSPTKTQLGTDDLQRPKTLLPQPSPSKITRQIPSIKTGLTKPAGTGPDHGVKSKINHDARVEGHKQPAAPVAPSVEKATSSTMRPAQGNAQSKSRSELESKSLSRRSGSSTMSKSATTGQQLGRTTSGVLTATSGRAISTDPSKKTMKAPPRPSPRTASLTTAPDLRSGSAASAASAASADSSQTDTAKDNISEVVDEAKGGSGVAKRRPENVVKLSETSSHANVSRRDNIASSIHKRNVSESSRSSRQESTVHKKPGFSTLQQHFPPKKPSKLPSQTETSRGPSDPSTGQGISGETAALQTKLLQLHLLHSTSDQTTSTWKQSARDKICERFESAASAHLELETVEKQEDARLNLYALKEWADTPIGTIDLEERLQLLGPLITEVVTVTERGGKFANIRLDFERWVSWTKEIWTSRDLSTVADHAPRGLCFVEDLGSSWTTQTEALSRRLLTHQRDVLIVGDVFDGSSLSNVISYCRSIIEGTLAELDLMRCIQKQIVVREQKWVASMITDVVADGKASSEAMVVSNPGKRGVWQEI